VRPRGVGPPPFDNLVEFDVAKTWTPDGWTRHEAKHLPVYEDAAALAEAEATLSNFPPLVFAGEARNLKASLAQVAEGKGFLL
jgi:3-deoxy-7-phosphoheptulonate synthase